MSNEVPDAVREYLRQLGSKTSERKAESSRANALKGAEARRKTEITCTCGRDVADPLAHAGTCRVYQAEYKRRKREEKKQEATQEQPGE